MIPCLKRKPQKLHGRETGGGGGWSWPHLAQSSEGQWLSPADSAERKEGGKEETPERHGHWAPDDPVSPPLPTSRVSQLPVLKPWRRLCFVWIREAAFLTSFQKEINKRLLYHFTDGACNWQKFRALCFSSLIIFLLILWEFSFMYFDYMQPFPYDFSQIHRHLPTHPALYFFCVSFFLNSWNPIYAAQILLDMGPALECEQGSHPLKKTASPSPRS